MLKAYVSVWLMTISTHERTNCRMNGWRDRPYNEWYIRFLSLNKAWFRRRFTPCAEPNWWIEHGRRAVSEPIWYGSFSLVRQKRLVQQKFDRICRTFVELNLGSTHGTCRLNQMSRQCRSKVELIHLGLVRHMKSTGVWTRPKPSTTSIYLHACPNEPKGTFISFTFGESWLLINYEIWGHITESGMRLKKTFFALLYLKTYKAGPKRPNVSHL